MGDIFEVLDIPKLISVLLLTIVPSILLFSLILYSDRKSREPVYLILICVFSGIFTICLSLLVDRLLVKTHFVVGNLITNANSYSIYKIVILASVEEYAKIMALYLFLYKNKAYDDIYDGFVYSSIIALSFSLIETFIYVFNEGTYADMTSLAILRNFTSIPLHLVCGVTMGHFVSLEKFSKTKKMKIVNLILSVFVPVLIHSLYNTFFSMVSISNGSLTSTFIILFFILSIYFVGIYFIYKTSKLNSIFIRNGEYKKKYRYLMTKDDYLIKERRRYV